MQIDQAKAVAMSDKLATESSLIQCQRRVEALESNLKYSYTYDQYRLVVEEKNRAIDTLHDWQQYSEQVLCVCVCVLCVCVCLCLCVVSNAIAIIILNGNALYVFRPFSYVLVCSVFNSSYMYVL